MVLLRRCSVRLPGLGDGSLSTVQGILIHLLGYLGIQLLGWDYFSRSAVLPQIHSWQELVKLAEAGREACRQCYIGAI